jgi:hypothetical protein
MRKLPITMSSALKTWRKAMIACVVPTEQFTRGPDETHDAQHADPLRPREQNGIARGHGGRLAKNLPTQRYAHLADVSPGGSRHAHGPVAGFLPQLQCCLDRGPSWKR